MIIGKDRFCEYFHLKKKRADIIKFAECGRIIERDLKETDSIEDITCLTCKATAKTILAEGGKL